MGRLASVACAPGTEGKFPMEAGPSRVLVVDESPLFQQRVAALLAETDYAVRCVSSGEEALRIVDDEPCNLVLTEINLPGMSGLNLLKLIKERHPQVEVVIISNNASAYTAIKSLRFGAYDYIIKPVDDTSVLQRVVERTLEKQRLVQENARLIADLSIKNQEMLATLGLMKAVNRICATIASSLDITEILTKLVESAVSQLKADRGYLLLLDKGTENFSMKVTVGIDPSIVKNFSLPWNEGISGLVATRNRPLRIDNAPSPEMTRRILAEDISGDLFLTPGILAAPLRLKDRVIGVVTVSGRSSGTPFSEAEIEFLSTLANHAAIALANAGTLYKLKRAG
jgi:DNA-binding response OmpR family regulator